MGRELTKMDLIRIWLWIDQEMSRILTQGDLKRWWKNEIPSLEMTPQEALKCQPGALVEVVKSYSDPSYS